MPVHPDNRRPVIKNWSASPSGGAITINGTDDQGQPVKLRGVKRVESGRVPAGLFKRSFVVMQAVMPDGTRHTLA